MCACLSSSFALIFALPFVLLSICVWMESRERTARVPSSFIIIMCIVLNFLSFNFHIKLNTQSGVLVPIFMTDALFFCLNDYSFHIAKCGWSHSTTMTHTHTAEWSKGSWNVRAKFKWHIFFFVFRLCFNVSTFTRLFLFVVTPSFVATITAAATATIVVVVVAHPFVSFAFLGFFCVFVYLFSYFFCVFISFAHANSKSVNNKYIVLPVRRIYSSWEIRSGKW